MLNVIALDNDKATILGKDINLHRYTSGHYCNNFFTSSNCSNIEENEQRKVQVTKIHKQLNCGMQVSKI